MLSTRNLIFLPLLSLSIVYGLTIYGFSTVKEATFSELSDVAEGEWRNVCGTVKTAKIYETVAFIAFEETDKDVSVFKDNFDDVHVNELREHDFLCMIVNIDRYKGQKTFTARRLGYLSE